MHISLGLFLKFYELLLDECEDLDVKIAAKQAEPGAAAGNTAFDQYVNRLHDARKHHQLASAYQESAQQAEGYATYLVTADGQTHTEEQPNPLVMQLLQHAQDMRNNATEEVHIYSY